MRSSKRVCTTCLFVLIVTTPLLFVIYFTHYTGDLNVDSFRKLPTFRLSDPPLHASPAKMDKTIVVEVRDYGAKKIVDRTHFSVTKRNNSSVTLSKYMHILSHYEQLGKTTINFLQAALLSSRLDRHIVEPLVRNSRFCGLKTGWTGAPRKWSREFLPMENYFNMSSVDSVFNDLSLPHLVGLDDFVNNCPSVTMLYFFYVDNKIETKRYLQISDQEYSDLVSRMKLNGGHVDCSFVEERIKTSSHTKGLHINKGVCLDAEYVTRYTKLNHILPNEKCISIFIWRGVGVHRTHFNASFPNSRDHYLSKISLSPLILTDVQNFIADELNNEQYIGIHIRSERQLLWYTIDRFVQCLDKMERVVNALVANTKLRIFIASDLSRHGSDQIKLLNESLQTEARRLLEAKLRQINAVFFRPDKMRGLIFNDAGFVALTELEILARAQHLVTLGTGTFQGWIVSTFEKYRSKTSTLKRVCSNEFKNYNDRKKNHNMR